MADKKIENWKWSWKTAALVALLAGMMAALYWQFSSGKAEAYCLDNPEDNVTCQCTNWIVAHVRFWDEFNDTTPDILEMVKNNTYQERLGTTTVASIIGETLLISNVTPEYNIFYNYEVIPRRCVEAVKKQDRKPKYEKIEVTPSYNMTAEVTE